MIGLSRSVVALLLAIVTVHFSGSALAEPMSDRAFFVRWADSGNNKELLGVHFADARTGWVVGRGGRIVATRDGGSSWAAQQRGPARFSGVCILPTRAPAGRSVMTGRSWRRGTAGPAGRRSRAGPARFSGVCILPTRAPAGRLVMKGRPWRRGTAGPAGRLRVGFLTPDQHRTVAKDLRRQVNDPKAQELATASRSAIPDSVLWPRRVPGING
jgi:hypothetical protein